MFTSGDYLKHVFINQDISFGFPKNNAAKITNTFFVGIYVVKNVLVIQLLLCDDRLRQFAT